MVLGCCVFITRIFISFSHCVNDMKSVKFVRLLYFLQEEPFACILSVYITYASSGSGKCFLPDLISYHITEICCYVFDLLLLFIFDNDVSIILMEYKKLYKMTLNPRIYAIGK